MSLAGRRIGPYRLLHLLGSGGMGEVYEAEQESPVRRAVALKISRAGLDPEQTQLRFAIEQQALALLDHPHIARVYDAGSTDDGRAWFAMERVDGIPITEWATHRGLDLEARVRLLLPLCEAVEHAHRKGVIHRDLKPANILVSDQASSGFPRIIDFGVAKLVESDASMTEAGSLVGTPEYMSPEQAALGDIDIDTRVDVHALGLVLYELLVGALPIGAAELGAHGFHAMCRRIRDEDVPVPSVRAASIDEPTTRSWRHRLRGDLDAVLLKALARDRERRYDSVAAFAADLRRYLDGDAVSAQTPSLRYRAGKFVRRNRAGVSAVAAVMLALIAAGGLAGHGLVEARRGELHAREAGIEAERQRVEAEATTGFLVELFQGADPRNQPGLDLTARELLERGVQRIDRIEAQPAVQANLLAKLGDLYWVLGDSARAEPLLRRSLALRGDDTEGRIEVLNRLAGLLRDRHDYEEAEALYREAIALLATIRQLDTPREVTLLNNFGILLARTRQFGEAEVTLARGIELIERHAAADPKAHQGWRNNVANLLGNLAQVRHGNGDTAGAIIAARRSLELFSAQLPAEHPRLAVVHSNLAFLSSAVGRYGDALAHGERAVAIDRVALPSDHPTAAAHLLNLGQVQLRMGRFAEAEATLTRSLDMYRVTRGDGSYDLTRPLGWLGLRAFAEGEVELAVERTAETCRRIAAADHPHAARDRAVCMRRLFVFLSAMDGEAAAAMLTEAQDAALASGDEGEVALLQLAEALLLKRQGQVEAAARRWREAEALAACREKEPCVLDQALEQVSRAHWWTADGNVARAIQALSVAIDHPRWTPWMLADARLDALRGKPGWAALEEKLASRVARGGT